MSERPRRERASTEGAARPSRRDRPRPRL